MDATNANAPGQGGVSGNFQSSDDQFSYPHPTSVKGRTLADLLDGQQITHLDVWSRHSSSRAAHHILMLRRAGWPVQTREIDAPTKDGRVAHIAEYSLPAEAIQAAGDRGRRFIEEARRG